MLLEQENQSGHPVSPGFCVLWGFWVPQRRQKLCYLSYYVSCPTQQHGAPAQCGSLPSWDGRNMAGATSGTCSTTGVQSPNGPALYPFHSIGSQSRGVWRKQHSSQGRRMAHNGRRMLNKHSLCYKHAMRPRLLCHNVTHIHGCQTLLSRQVNGIQGHL